VTSPFDDVKKGESYLRELFVIFCVVVLYGYLCVLDM